ncbi:NAD-binding protein, partial [Streptomyces sp. SID7982]|nr:NAD-binding protein [Streptomyces sp. SID7982]
SPANRDYRPGFAAPLMAKDLGLAANAVRAGGVDAELGLRAAELYARFAEEGGAEQDFSGIVRAIRAASSTTNDAEKGATP